MTFLYVAEDPGVPLGEWEDPLAGLDRSVGKALLEGDAEEEDEEDEEDDADETGWAGYPFAHRGVEEGKAIGSAALSGDLAIRDSSMRSQARGNVRMHIRQASRNATRDLREVYELVEEQVGRLLSQWVDGRIQVGEVRAESARIWASAYERTRDIGRKASGLERLHPQAEILSEEETWFRGAVREELRYWNLFLSEVLRDRRASRFNEARMWERFGAYVKALRFMYEASRVQALPDNLLFYWMGPRPVVEDPRQERRICRGCTWLMERSPFTKDTLPAVPRDGSTTCLTNCRHRLVVRVANPLDVERRRRSLGERADMSRALRARKDRDHGTWRQNRAREVARSVARRQPHVRNPFIGSRLPTNPVMYQGVPRPDERRPLTESELFGPIPIDRRLKRIEESTQPDASSRRVDLYYAARQLESRLGRSPVDPAEIQPVLDRFVGALEETVLASESQRFSRAMHSVVGRLWQAVDRAGLAESDAGIVLGAAAGVI